MNMRFRVQGSAFKVLFWGSLVQGSIPHAEPQNPALQNPKNSTQNPEH